MYFYDGDGGYEAMELDRYQRAARRTDINRGTDTAAFVLLGLLGEAGSVLAEVKKKQRDRVEPPKYRDRVIEELGDLLWYIAVTADRNGIRLGPLAQRALTKRELEVHKSPSKLTFADIQKIDKAEVVEPSLLLEWRLIDLAASAARVLTEHREFLRKKRGDSEGIFSSLADLFGDLLHVSSRTNIALSTVAKENLKKIDSRWPSQRTYEPSRDRRFPAYERLPTTLTVKIVEVKGEGDSYFVYQSCNGVLIGDRLTDNISDPDNYRFHDVFHYAYAAVLGWSPVTRALFKLKRKSDKALDEAEDGARAILIEEGVASFVFNEAKSARLFEGVDRGRLSFDLLKQIRHFVDGYEVQDAPYWAWEEAILQGFEAFRFLQEHRRGVLTLNGRAIVMGHLHEDD